MPDAINLDMEILRALRNPEAGWVSGAELSASAGVTRAAVWGRVEELRQLGYQIEANPHQGYRLIASPDLLHADDLMARLPRRRIIGRDIRVFKETGSTNDTIERIARDGTPEGVVVFAESQSRGRGRLGRAWSSPAGKGLWFSVLLRPAIRPQEATRLTIASATALRRAMQKVAGVNPAIKWPNDLLIDGTKVAGILTELSAETDRVRYVILGIGIDVNQTASDFPKSVAKVATSLRVATGASVDRARLAAEILRQLDLDYALLNKGQFQEIAEEWEAGCDTVGKDVSIRVGGHLVEGRAEALDADGALLVRTQHGHLECVTGGDVTLEK